MSTRRLSAVLLALTLACGGPTEPEAIRLEPLSLAILSGDGQEVEVTDTLPSDVVVKVEEGGEPVVDQLVDWAILSDHCGEAFVTTTRTDSRGVTGNRLVAGTRAWTSIQNRDNCTMEVRYTRVVSDTVQARVDTTVSYLVMPGPWAGREHWTGHYQPTDTLGLGALYHDAYDNEIPPSAWSVSTDDTAIVAALSPDSVRSLPGYEDFRAAFIIPRDTGTAWVDVTVGDSITPNRVEAVVTREGDSLLVEAWMHDNR